VAIGEIDEAATPRLSSGIGEFDRVLGGGIVPGSVVLVGGEPGIGKSTLLLQVANAIAGSGAKVMYISSEESARQTALRAGRLGVKGSDLLVLAQTNVERIVHQIARHQPAVAIVDSIQMIYKPALAAAPGSVTQLRDAAWTWFTWPRPAGRRLSWSATSPRRGRWRGQSSSSISWTRWRIRGGPLPRASHRAMREESLRRNV